MTAGPPISTWTLFRQDTLSWFIMFYVVGSALAITDGVSMFNLTNHNRSNRAEIISHDPFRRNNNTLNPFIIGSVY